MLPLDVIVFGAGYAGARVCETATRRGLRTLAVVRSPASAERLQGRGFEVTTALATDVAAERLGPVTHAVVTFPPDPTTDVPLAALLAGARAVSYLSTTGVYQDIEGVVDDLTPLPPNPSPKYALVLATEAAYRAVGASVLRSPGIYGPERGLHVRLRRGDFKLVGDGGRYGSRIHVEDLAALLLASDRAPGETFVVGDLEPTRQRDLVSWLCARLGVPFPASAPVEAAPESLRRNRRVNAARALRTLGIELKYPNYRSGYGA